MILNSTWKVIKGVRKLQVSEKNEAIYFLFNNERQCMDTAGYIVTTSPLLLQFQLRSRIKFSQSVQPVGKRQRREHLIQNKVASWDHVVCSFIKKELSPCTFSGNFLSRCSFEVLWLTCSERLYSQTSLLKTRKASESCFSNGA